MQFDFENFILGEGFHRDPANKKVFYNSTYDVKIKFIYPEGDGFKNIVLTSPGKKMPKLTYEFPLTRDIAEGVVVPYLKGDESLTKGINEFEVSGVMTTKIKRADHITTCYVELLDSKGSKEIGVFDCVGHIMELLDCIPEQTRVNIIFKIHGSFIRNKYVTRLNVINIWKA